MVVFSCSMPRVRRRRKTLAALLQPLGRVRPAQRPPGSASANPALEAIWHAVCNIPRGRVATYGGVARAAGLPGRARQAGYALRVAGDSLNLPWHRVVGAGGRIAFPSASRAHREQARLLRAEGVAVAEGRVARSALIDLEEP
jgi:methylated-DNA-protein-cysteine methyltransferase-like protein